MPSTDDRPPSPPDLQAQVIDLLIRVTALSVLAAACFWILAPFLLALAWGVIIAVAAYPLFSRLEVHLGGRSGMAALLIALGLLLLLLVPATLLAGSVWQGAQALAGDARSGEFQLPPPPAGVADWPLIGPGLYDFWQQAYSNLSDVLRGWSSEIRAGLTWVLSTAAGTGFGLLQFVLATAISAVLLAHADDAREAASRFARRLADEDGPAYLGLAADTVQGVTRGILGVAVLQSTLAGIGFFAVGLPGAGLLSLLCLLVTVIQLPVAVITLPAVLYVVSTADGMVATLFVIWNILLAPADNILKPLLLGRGARVPTLVLFLGSLGGFMAAGLIGLFVGAVILSLGFVLYGRWLEPVVAPQSGDA